MIRLNSIHKTYNFGKVNEFEALKGISLEIETGEMVAIIGKSGAGKTTLLHILACIDSYESGEYYIDGKLVRSLTEKQRAEIRNEKIGIVMQDFALVDDFSVIDNVMIPLDFSLTKKKNKRKTALNALKLVGIEHLSEKSVNQLSGGQKQRTAIARAIVNDPQIILADEPTGALDSKTASGIMDILRKLHTEGKTVIIATHDSGIATQCQRIIEISDGRVINA